MRIPRIGEIVPAKALQIGVIYNLYLEGKVLSPHKEYQINTKEQAYYGYNETQWSQIGIAVCDNADYLWAWNYASIEDGSYYKFYNLGTDSYLNYNSSANKVTLGPIVEPWKIVKDNELYTIRPGVREDLLLVIPNKNYNHGVAASLYTEGEWYNKQQQWHFIQSGTDKIFYIQNH